MKRWNESRLHTRWCTPAKTLVTPFAVCIALSFNSQLSTHSNLLRFIVYSKSEQNSSNRKVYKQNNVADIQFWCWKRHIVAFLSFYFVAIFSVVVVCSCSASPWHPSEINEHTWTIYSMLEWLPLFSLGSLWIISFFLPFSMCLVLSEQMALWNAFRIFAFICETRRQRVKNNTYFIQSPA